MMTPVNLVFYTSSCCRDCREAKRFLETHKIPYTEVDIETTPGAASELIAHTGKRAIPYFFLDGKWIQPYRPGHGFLHEEMCRLFGIGQHAPAECR